MSCICSNASNGVIVLNFGMLGVIADIINLINRVKVSVPTKHVILEMLFPANDTCFVTNSLHLCNTHRTYRRNGIQRGDVP